MLFCCRTKKRTREHIGSKERRKDEISKNPWSKTGKWKGRHEI
jgi:hypothetical protein